MRPCPCTTTNTQTRAKCREIAHGVWAPARRRFHESIPVASVDDHVCLLLARLALRFPAAAAAAALVLAFRLARRARTRARPCSCAGWSNAGASGGRGRSHCHQPKPLLRESLASRRRARKHERTATHYGQQARRTHWDRRRFPPQHPTSSLPCCPPWQARLQHMHELISTSNGTQEKDAPAISPDCSLAPKNEANTVVSVSSEHMAASERRGKQVKVQEQEDAHQSVRTCRVRRGSPAQPSQ